MKGASLARLVLVAWLRAAAADTAQTAQSSSSSSSASSTRSSSEVTTTSSIAAQLTEIPTNSRATYPSEQITFTVQSSANATASISSFNQTVTSSSSSGRETLLHGATTASSFASAPTNSDARCNGYAEFCERKYSNITYVIAHNSPFHRANNAASNQDFDVTTQLDNGVRGSEY